MASKMISIMLVDDHTLIREGIKYIVESEKDLKVVTEASDGNEAIGKASYFKPDIIIMDIHMPNLNGLDALRNMKDTGVKSKVIMLTAYEHREYILEATKLGAKGYLFKNSASDNLIRAIREVNLGRSYIEPSVANVLTKNNIDNNDIQNNTIDKLLSLSRREYEVLSLISSGLNNKEIGDKLFISEKTVKNHITNIFKKIEVEDRVQATIFALNNGIRKNKEA